MTERIYFMEDLKFKIQELINESENITIHSSTPWENDTLDRIMELIQSLRKSDMEAIERMIGDNFTPSKISKNDFSRHCFIGRNIEKADLRSKLKEYREKNGI